MSHRLLRDASFHRLLLSFDHDLTGEARARGCPLCGGRLDSANFPRQPWGVPQAVLDTDPDFRLRLGLCCDACRHRTTPASTRFLWRRFYVAAMVVLVGALAQGLTPRRVDRLRALYDVSKRTLERWRAWWSEAFPATDLWRARAGDFVPRVTEAALPRGLLVGYGGPRSRVALMRLLQFLAPLGASEHARRGLIADPQRTRFDARKRDQ